MFAYALVSFIGSPEDKIMKNLNAVFVLVLCVVLLAGYYLQFFRQESPCPLCLLQRLGMIGVAVGLLMNLKFGIRASHYALSLLFAMFSGFVSLRHIGLQVCPEFAALGEPILGLYPFTWAFLVIACSILAISILLFFYKPVVKTPKNPSINPLGKVAFAMIFLLTAANVLTALHICGLGTC